MVALASLAHADPWTVEEWIELVTTAENGRRYELVEGSILVSPSPTISHQYAADRLRTMLERHAPADLIVLTGVGVPLEDAGLIPDVLVIERAAANATMPPASAVRLVVEVVSPSSRSHDRTIKPVKYAAAGIRHFWRLEPRPFRGQLPDERLPVLFTYSLDERRGEYELVHRIGAGMPSRLEQPFRTEFNLDDLLP